MDPAIASHGGRIVKTTGDGLLLEFPSVVNAVRCAVEVQTAMADRTANIPEDQRIAFRIGINLGDIIVDGDDIFGDGVNIAARLEVLAEPGGICLSDDAIHQVRGKIDVSFVEMGPQSLKNIDQPVHAWRWSPSGPSVAPAAPPSLALPDKPSIAVLPFLNVSGDAEQEYFSDGITEDIITELSRFRELFVIARNSSFSYKGKSPDVRRIGRELGVRYVLEGSIRRAGNRIRVTGQLIDALTGNHIWVQRYDRILDDVFAIQEELTRSIVQEIAPNISSAEVTSARRRPGNLTSYQIAICALAKIAEAAVKSDAALRQQALEDARAALAIDATNTLALDAIALAQFARFQWETIGDREAAWQEGYASATKSIELDPNGALAHSVRGMLISFGPDPGRRREALFNLQRGHDLNPNSIASLAYLAFGKIEAGDAATAVELLHQASRRNPRDAFGFAVRLQMARASFALKDYRAGVEQAEQGLAERPAFPGYLRILALNLVGQGDLEGAKLTLRKCREIAPEYVELGLNGQLGYAAPEQRQRALTFLRVAAGLEGASAAETLR